jgi:5-methyltetrahydropteroyltriglutamate--homocysteine methyltransferase
MAARTKAPFRADHVGSLLRPKELLEVRERAKKGQANPTELRGLEDVAIRHGIRMQEEIGLKAITDGEMRRSSWHMDFLYQVGGVKKVQDNLSVQFKNKEGTIEFTPSALQVADKLKLALPIFADDFLFVKNTAKSGTAKLTIPSPSMMHYRGGRAAINEQVYPKLDEFWTDLSKVYADEIAALGKIGCQYLQLDDTSLAYLNDPNQREYIKKLGGDAQKQHLTYIKVINDAVKNKPKDMVITTHMCRGNFRSSWVAEGGYDYVAEAMFNDLMVDGFFLEYDDERSGTFEPLRFVPKNKMVVLGLVTTKKAELEKKDDLKRRIDAAAKFIPLDQLCLSPQCGFSSTVEGNAVNYDQQVAKLKLVVETAREVWGD